MLSAAGRLPRRPRGLAQAVGGGLQVCVCAVTLGDAEGTVCGRVVVRGSWLVPSWPLAWEPRFQMEFQRGNALSRHPACRWGYSLGRAPRGATLLSSESGLQVQSAFMVTGFSADNPFPEPIKVKGVPRLRRAASQHRRGLGSRRWAEGTSPRFRPGAAGCLPLLLLLYLLLPSGASPPTLARSRRGGG